MKVGLGGRWIGLHAAAFVAPEFLGLGPVRPIYAPFWIYIARSALPLALGVAVAQAWGGGPVRGVRGWMATLCGMLLGFAAAWAYTTSLNITWDEDIDRRLAAFLNVGLGLLGPLSTGLILGATQAVVLKERRLLWIGVTALAWTLSSALVQFPAWLWARPWGNIPAPVLLGVQGLLFAMLELPWLRRWAPVSAR